MIPDSFADNIHVSVWSDAVVDQLGHDPRSQYVEWFWLAVLGPTSIWFLRRVRDALDHAPDGFTLDVNECAAALGIAGPASRHSAIQRTLRRTVQFGAARAHSDHQLQVRRRLPPLNRSQVSRLPSSLRVAHDDWTAEELRLHEATRAAS